MAYVDDLTNALGLNPDKTELVLFTNEHKVPIFKTPTLSGVSR